MPQDSILNLDGLDHLLDKLDEKFDKKVDIVSGKGLSTNDYTTDEKTKLAGIASGANKYSHPTTSGNKHIPSGGSSGQILRWSADGTATWGSDNNTWTAFKGATASANGTAGYIPAPTKGNQNKFFRADGTWATPSPSSSGHGFEISSTEPSGQSTDDEWLKEY